MPCYFCTTLHRKSYSLFLRGGWRFAALIPTARLTLPKRGWIPGGCRRFALIPTSRLTLPTGGRFPRGGRRFALIPTSRLTLPLRGRFPRGGRRFALIIPASRLTLPSGGWLPRGGRRFASIPTSRLTLPGAGGWFPGRGGRRLEEWWIAANIITGTKRRAQVSFFISNAFTVGLTSNYKFEFPWIQFS